MEPDSVSKTALWAGRVVSALPVLLLLFSGGMKLAKPVGLAKGFADLGYPIELASILGIVEVGSTIIYVIPQTAVLGAILLTGYLGGAVATHARLQQPQFVMPFIVGVLVWLGLYLRDARVRRLIPLRS